MSDQKPVAMPAPVGPAAPQATVVELPDLFVNTIDELYEAVYHGSNAGRTIFLASGTYQLDSDNPIGKLKDGRLELQLDMSMVGETGNPSDVIIDVSKLPSTSFVLSPTVRTAPLRIGNGNNSIAGISIINSAANANNARSLIQTDLVNTSLSLISISKTILSGADIGLSVINRGTESNNRMLEVELSECIISGNQTGPGSGVQVQNSNGAIGASIIIRMANNTLKQNKNGFYAFNTDFNNHIVVTSLHDTITENGVGCLLLGGLNGLGSQGGPAEYNRTYFNAQETYIAQNIGGLTPLYPYERGCIFAAAGSVTNNSAPNTVSNNRLSISLTECSFIEVGVGLYAYGAFSRLSTPAAAGVSNFASVFVKVNRVSYQAVNSDPADSDGSNKVIVKVKEFHGTPE